MLVILNVFVLRELNINFLKHLLRKFFLFLKKILWKQTQTNSCLTMCKAQFRLTGILIKLIYICQLLERHAFNLLNLKMHSLISSILTSFYCNYFLLMKIRAEVFELLTCFEKLGCQYHKCCFTKMEQLYFRYICKIK